MGQERASLFLGVCRVHAVPVPAETCCSYVESQRAQPGFSSQDPHRPLPLEQAQHFPGNWGAPTTILWPQKGFPGLRPTFPLRETPSP